MSTVQRGRFISSIILPALVLGIWPATGFGQDPCGNGVLDPGEDCDGGACCTAQCTFAAAGAVCDPGDGACTLPALCDGTSASCPENDFICLSGDDCCPAVSPALCNANIDTDCDAVCGNNVLEPGEVCDDGNLEDADGCHSDCTVSGPDIPALTPLGAVTLALALLVGLGIVIRRGGTPDRA